MTQPAIIPDAVALSAFSGDGEVMSPTSPKVTAWGARETLLSAQRTLAPKPIDMNDWRNPDVGWGVVMADRADVDRAAKAIAADAPAPIRDLIIERGSAPVFRVESDRMLVRYNRDGTMQRVAIGLTDYGTGQGRLPFYLLIVGSPQLVGWEVQFALNRNHRVGRLDLPAEGLDNYVNALRSNWAGCNLDPGAVTIWSTKVDAITTKMQRLVADFLAGEFAKDPEITVHRHASDDATNARLLQTLKDFRPSVVVTSSHGRTAPLDDPISMRATLGNPVDANLATLDVDELASWTPSGAVWYSQACCSAGSNQGTSYAGLFTPDSTAAKVTDAVGLLGAQIAPMPARLLSTQSPLRAFVGHVEPTFDWTLLLPENGAPLTMPLVRAISRNLFSRDTIGNSFASYYAGVGELYARLVESRKDVDKMKSGAAERSAYYKLTAIDRQSLVILGDPTALLPPLPSQR